MAAVIAAIVLALVVGTGGVIYAADAAGPGDPLYGIDQAVESARLGLTHRPEAVMELLISLADERLLEAEELAAEQDEANLGVALEDYGATVSSLAQTLGTVEDADNAALTALLDSTFSNHERRLARILGPAVAADEGEEAEEEEGGAEYCVGADPHPTAQRLAETYDVPYEDIMGWFCQDGFGMGEIEHALQTAAATGMSAGEVLGLKTQLGGWGEVWQELGLIGAADDDDDAEEPAEEEDLAYCVGADPHPTAQRLAETYDVPYEQIMTWFCQERYGLGEIMHALQTTGGRDGDAAEQLLQLKTELGGWGQAWQELGLIGRTKEKPAKDDTGKPEKLPKVKPEKKDKPNK